MKAVVVGLGRIGLPVALVLADSGIRTIGVDTDSELIRLLGEGKAPFQEKGVEDLLAAHSGSGFLPRTWDDLEKMDIGEVDFLVITIGIHNLPFPEPAIITPLFEIIGKFHSLNLIDGSLIVMRPTLPIGTTNKIIQHISIKYGKEVGSDYHMAYVPERLMEGRAIEEERSLPKCIGPATDSCFEKAKDLFSIIGGEILRLPDPSHAEFGKLIDNSWRHTRFAFSNDLAMVAESENLNLKSVLDSVNTGYERNNIASPGPVSGYCLGKDPLILEYSMMKVPERESSLWMSSLDSSNSLINWVENKIEGEKILIAGATFKEDIDDVRMSFSEKLVSRLLEMGKDVDIADPFIGMNRYTDLWPSVSERFSGRVFSDIRECLSKNKFDSVVIAVRHSDFIDLEGLLSKQNLVIDLWNLFDGKIGNRIGLGT